MKNLKLSISISTFYFYGKESSFVASTRDVYEEYIISYSHLLPADSGKIYFMSLWNFTTLPSIPYVFSVFSSSQLDSSVRPLSLWCISLMSIGEDVGHWGESAPAEWAPLWAEGSAPGEAGRLPGRAGRVCAPGQDHPEPTHCHALCSFLRVFLIWFFLCVSFCSLCIVRGLLNGDFNSLKPCSP